MSQCGFVGLSWRCYHLVFGRVEMVVAGYRCLVAELGVWLYRSMWSKGRDLMYWVVNVERLGQVMVNVGDGIVSKRAYGPVIECNS